MPDPVMMSSPPPRAHEPVRLGPELTLKLDQAWRILNLNQELIRSADQKTYLCIVMSTLLVSYVATNIERIIRLGMTQSLLLALFIGVSGTFYYFALSTLFPRQRKAVEDGCAKLIFFGDIAGRARPEDYIRDLAGATPETLHEDISRQIYLVAQVARGKYLAYRRAWHALLMEVGLFVVLEFSMALGLNPWK